MNYTKEQEQAIFLRGKKYHYLPEQEQEKRVLVSRMNIRGTGISCPEQEQERQEFL